MIVSSALMIWKGLMVVTGSESPIVVVLSGSMEPAFQVSSFKSFSFVLPLFIGVFDVLSDYPNKLISFFAERRPSLPDQLRGGGHQGGRDRCLQDRWQRHPNRAQVSSFQQL